MKTEELKFYGNCITVVRDQWGNDTRTVTRVENWRKNVNVLTPGTSKGDFKSPNAFRWDLSRRTLLEGTFTGLWNGDYGTYMSGALSSSSLYYSAFPQIDYTELYNQVLSECFEQLRNSSDWSITAIQGKQTSAMVKNAVNSIFKIARYAKKGDWRYLQDCYREFIRNGKGNAAANKWLEYQYGWKPLAQDAYNSIIELGKQFPSLMKIEKKRSRRTQIVNRDCGPYSTSLPMSTPVLSNGWSSIRVEMKMRFRPPTSTANLLSNFTSMNPVSIAWEAMPFSFIFDWAIDFGGYVRNLESSILMSGQFVDGYYTCSAKQEADLTCRGTEKNGSFVKTINAATLSPYLYQELNRTVLADIPIPRVPGLKLDLGIGRLENALALLVSARR